MIKAKDLLKRMTEHLSDWLVMRRNPEASNGGKVLLGIAQETEEIQEAIQEYVESHFISSYVSKTHAIDYEHMRIHVGTVNCNEIKLIQPFLEICDDLNLFENGSKTPENSLKTLTNSCNKMHMDESTCDNMKANDIECKNLQNTTISCKYSYYEKGYLYFKTSVVSEGDLIQYILGDTILSEKAERVPVWNIFDEFALYVGIERLPRENNENLLERILYQSHNPVNSTSIGIQNALANIAGIQPKEIIVEKIDEKNCYQNDFTGAILFEQLSEINRDIYRSKRWGIDYWYHDLDYVSYIPHEYDVKPGYYQDGIGDNEDLKVGVTRKNEIVHMEVKCYDKDEKTITEYHQKYPIDVETKLKLYKPKGEIDPIEVSALIEAGSLTDVTDTDFILTYKAVRSACEKQRLQDIIDTTGLNVKAKHHFEVGNSYRFKIKSKTPYGSLNAKILLDNESLIEEKEGFIKDELGYLSHTNIALYANQLSYFKEHTHFTHEIDGFKLSPSARSGQLVLPLKNMGGKTIHYTLNEPAFDPISDTAISYKGFYKSSASNSYISQTNTDPLFAIGHTANQIRFYIEGEAIIMDRSELGDTETKIANGYYETQAKVYSPIDHLIHIIPTDPSEPILIKEIEYNHFIIKNVLDHGEIIDNKLPAFDTNTLTISISTAMSLAPSISFIYVGEPLESIEYITKPFEYNNQDIDFFSRGDVIFTIEDITQNILKVCEDNTKIITALEVSDIKLNLEQYKTIEDIVICDGGHIIKKDGYYFLRLEKEESCEHLIIKGEIIDFTKYYSLGDLVEKKNRAKYYISPIAEGFIEAIDYDIKVIKPILTHLYGEYSLSRYEPFIPVFRYSQYSSETQNAKAPIDTFYLKATSEKVYKAINKQLMFEERKQDVPIDKNFSPLLPYNQILFYKVTSLTQGSQVLFYNKEKEQAYGMDWESAYSIDLKTLNYKTDFSLTERLRQEYQEVMLPIRLSKHVPLPNYVVNSSGDTLDLREYLITPEEGMRIHYTAPQPEDIAIDPSYIKTERFILSADGIKKLACCQIHEILYCGFTPYEENALSSITEYKLTNQLGVMKFSDYFTKQNYGRPIYIHYTITKPTILILSADKLYDIVPVTHEAYELMATQYHNSPIGYYKIDSEYFLNAQYVTVQVQEPGYIATASPKEGVIHIVESGPRDRIAIHKGFYYLNEEEYYMFGTLSDSHEEYKNDYIEAHEVNYMENGMMLHRRAENLIYNSAFNCGPLSRLFATDFSELDNVNYFRRLNACEQINLWQRCNMKAVLDKGLYGKGIYFAPDNKSTTAFMGMPIEQTGLDITLSFWLAGGASAVIYEQEKWEDEIHLTLSITKRIIHFQKEGEIWHADLPYNPNVFYYLALHDEGTIDDLILCEKSIYHISLHDKNINKLFMPQFESSKSDKQRFLFTHQKGFTGTMQMLSDGEIVPTSLMSYGYTPLLDKDWMVHSEKYKANYCSQSIVPEDPNAYVVSPVIKVESKEHIKEILVRANCFSDKNVSLIVYTGNSEKSLRPIASTVSEYIKIDRIEDYIQVRCNLEDTLYSLDISARYTEGAIPETYRQNIFESELFDMGEAGFYEIEKIKFKYFNNVQLFARSGKTSHLIDDYEQISLDENGIMNFNHQLGNARYLQFKIVAPSNCQLEYFDIINTGGR